MTSIFRKWSYTKFLFSSAPHSIAYFQLHFSAVRGLEVSLFFLCKELHELSSKWSEIILTVFLRLFQHFIGNLLLLNVTILSTLHGAALVFDHFHPAITFSLLLTPSAQLFCPLRNTLFVWAHRPYPDVCH